MRKNPEKKIYIVVVHTGDYPEDSYEFNLGVFDNQAAAQRVADAYMSVARHWRGSYSTYVEVEEMPLHQGSAVGAAIAARREAMKEDDPDRRRSYDDYDY